ncbi:hypothetical protein [Saccharothrix sp. NRRL B-16314]|uniref:hypothetical protein n=1 Tax=Saccharothrix sp. NRRL B-16314 TaxID=1463825 RepID=UPI0012DBD59E|nr:hypothetical protein [Saccharothrix sp. NRRL B-16314]
MRAPVEWPIASREALVRAFQPGGDETSEAPYRTLRRNHCATEGLSVRLRGGGRLQGQVRFFSRLNVRAAECARLGRFEQAAELADAARELETGEIFQRLADHFAELPRDAVTATVAGELLPELNVNLVRAAAEATRAAEPPRTEAYHSPVEQALAQMLIHHGHVSELHLHTARVRLRGDNSEILLPRPLLHGVHRDYLGGPVVVRTELSRNRAMVEVVPGIDLDPAPYSPVDRTDRRTVAITEEDADRLSGTAAPLFVPVPVVIHE